MLFESWPTIFHAVPTLTQHWFIDTRAPNQTLCADHPLAQNVEDVESTSLTLIQRSNNVMRPACDAEPALNKHWVSIWCMLVCHIWFVI